MAAMVVVRARVVLLLSKSLRSNQMPSTNKDTLPLHGAYNMDDRLGRVEAKIDIMQEAIVSLARVEERLLTVFSHQQAMEGKISELDHKVDTLTENMISSRILERIIWTGIVAAIGAAFTLIG